MPVNSMWHSFRNVGVFARPTTNWDRWPSSCRVFEKTGDTHSVIIQVRFVFLDRIGDLVPCKAYKEFDVLHESATDIVLTSNTQ